MDSSLASNTAPSVSDLPVMFRPPVNRAMRVLNRTFFRKKIPLSAATVFEISNISRVRNTLGQSNDLLTLPRLNNIRTPPGGPVVTGKGGQSTEVNTEATNRKCLILREEIKHDGGCHKGVSCGVDQRVS
jgi:tRNA (guanine37-N1)-methyltransferase